MYLNVYQRGERLLRVKAYDLDEQWADISRGPNAGTSRVYGDITAEYVK